MKMSTKIDKVVFFLLKWTCKSVLLFLSKLKLKLKE